MTELPMMDKRNRSRLDLLQHMPKNGICAEIGVWRGDFPQLILKHTEVAPASPTVDRDTVDSELKCNALVE